MRVGEAARDSVASHTRMNKISYSGYRFPPEISKRYGFTSGSP